MNFLTDLFDKTPRRVFALISMGCIAMLAYGLYLQHFDGLEPCPMCIVQRYALFAVAIIAGVTALSARKGVHMAGGRC